MGFIYKKIHDVVRNIGDINGVPILFVVSQFLFFE
jgi:hypothetical protein